MLLFKFETFHRIMGQLKHNKDNLVRLPKINKRSLAACHFQLLWEKSLFNLKVSSYNSDNYGVTNSVLFSRDDPNGSLFRNFRFLVITSHADYFFGSPPSVSLPFFGDNQRSWKINSAPSLRQARVHFSPVPMVTKSQNLPLERFHD